MGMQAFLRQVRRRVMGADRAGQLRKLPRRLVLERLEDRTAPTITTTGIPFWISQGPGPSTGGQTEGLTAQNNPVAGAVNAIASDPSNPNILYAATVNGGVWRTLNATSSSPSWSPLTDLYPSLSMGDVEFSPVNTNVLYAGTARFSSGFEDGGPLNGVLRTNDGGNTWTMLGQSTFAGLSIRKVRPTALNSGAVVLVATTNGVYRSPDSGVNWTRISGTSELPSGDATDLVSDPGNVNRFYTAIPGQGIYRSDNGGLNWVPANSNIPVATISGSNYIELATHNSTGNNVVYVVLFGTTNSVFRSTNQGGSWVAMEFPGQTELVHGTPTFIPAGPSGFVADPANPTIIYISGGGSQPLPTDSMGHVSCPNSLGACNYTDRAFRGDAALSSNQWSSITNNGANGTSPHADNRDLKFDVNGNLISASDGGIYRLINPSLSSRNWVSVNGTITPTEFYSVAYDQINHTIIGGTQDTGSPEQVSGLSWRDVTQGDGGVAAVDNITLAGSNQSIHYSSNLGLGGFKRRVLNNSNVLVSSTLVGLNVSGTSPIRTLSQVEANVPTGSTLTALQPYVLNNVDPRRMIIGTDFLYESSNMGDTLTSVGGLTNLGGGNWRPNNPIGRVNTVTCNDHDCQQASKPIDYGGFSGGIANADVLWIGAGGQLHLRTSGSGLPGVVTAYPGSAVVAVKMDPTDWHTAYVVDFNGRVWRTTDTGTSWANLTGNLPSLATDLRTIEVVRSGGNVAVLVGGRGGVYRALNPGLATATWSRFGSDLSFAPVRDLHYNSNDDVLSAGTDGRGAWKVMSASATLFQTSAVTVGGTGGNDTIRLVRDSNIPGVLNIFLNSAAPVLSVVASAVQQITINGGGGNDTINIDDTFPLAPVTVNMSTASCTVNISSIEHDLSHVQGDVTVNGATSGSDILTVNDQADSANTTYTLLANEIERTGAGLVTINNLVRSVTLNGGNGFNAYNVNGTENDFATVISTGNSADVVNVRATGTFSTLLIDTPSGSLSSVSTVTIGNAGSLAFIRGAVTVHNVPSRDQVTIDDSTDSGNHPAVTISGGAVTGLAPAPINYDGFSLSALTVNGGTGNNTYTITGTPANTTVNTGSGADAVNVQGISVPLTVDTLSGGIGANSSTVTVGNAGSLAGIGAALTIHNNPSRDVVVLNDNTDSTNRIVTISSGGITGLNTFPINFTNFSVSALTLNGGTGNNGYTITGTPVAQSMTLNTGTGADAVNVQGTSAPLTVDTPTGTFTSSSTVTVGNAGSVQGILFPLTIHNQPARDTLTLDDSADGGNRTVTVGSGGVTGLAPASINFTSFSISALTVNGGTGNSTYIIIDTPAVFVGGMTLNTGLGGNVANVQGTSAPLTVNTGSGDTVNITSSSNTLDPIGGVAINDPTGTSTLVVDDSGYSGSDTYGITSSTVTIGRPSNFFLTYNGIGALIVNTGPGSDLLLIDSTSVATTVNAGTGGNIFRISPVTQYLAASIVGHLTLNGGGGDILEFFDGNDPSSETFNFDAVPMSLTLGSTGTDITDFFGMGGGVYLETNGFSSVNDASGTVLVDMPPP